MNISTVRLIVPLCGLLSLAVPSSNAKEPKSNNLRTAASPSPSPKSNARIKPSVVVKIKPNAKASPTPKPGTHNEVVGIDYRPGGDKQKYKAKASPTPTPKAK